jgi:PKD repeat protein
LRLYDIVNGGRKVEAVWNFTAIAAAPKVGHVKFNVQTNDALKTTVMMIADRPFTEINASLNPQGASELRITNNRFEVHNGNTWTNIRAAAASTTYDVELHYKIGTGWHVIIDGVKYGGDYAYGFSFTGNPPAMRLFEVTTSLTDNGPYYSYFDDIDCSWTPNTDAPTITAGSVTPSLGTNQTTQFTYSVTYTDADNNPPQWVNVTLDGSRVFQMAKQNPLDSNYLDGCVYRYITYLNVGNHSYFFNASDGTRAANLGPYYGPTAEPQWNRVSLSGVQIGCVITHGELNPRTRYVGAASMVADLNARGAVLTDISATITAGVLSGYKIIWIDEGATSTITTAELDAIEVWVRAGGNIIVTGDDTSSSHTEYRVLNKFLIYIYSLTGYSGTSPQVYSHQITRSVTNVYYNPQAYLGLWNQPLATLCGELLGFDMVAAMTYGKGKFVVISDDTTFLSYTMANNRQLGNNTFGWLGYAPRNNFDPALTDGSVNPNTGWQNTPFTFRVTYTDADNNPPEYVRVSINGTAWNMTKLNPYDFDFTDGCIYTLTTYLQPGASAYQYVFQAFDGARTGTSITYTGPTVSYSNAFSPSLNSPLLFPNRGYDGRTRFNFSVTYMDRDNNAPQFINVWLNSTQHAMTKENASDVDYTNGCNYVLRMQIPVAGNYSYSFNASDGGAIPVSQGTYHDLEVETYEPIYFDGMQYAWTGYFNWTGMVEEGLDEFRVRSGVIFDVETSPDNSFQGSRVVNASSRLLNETSTDIWLYTHEWTRIFIDIGIGSPVLISILSSPEQVFTVAGETYVVAMGRAFECWVLLSPEGSVAYYDKFSGILVNGTFNSQGNRQYNFEVRSTNVVLESNSLAPTLSGESVAPAGGNQATPYVFSVAYTDLDDNAPASIDVVINGTPHAMQRLNPADTNMADGCTYQFTTYLQPGTYPWLINCTDGVHAAATGLQPGLVVTWSSLSQATLTLGTVSPKNGFNGTTPFTFQVLYKDGDNNQPSAPVQVDINGTNYEMVKKDPADGNYMDGCTYVYTTHLSIVGTYTYYFYTSDGMFFITDGPYSDLKVGLTRSMFLDDAVWEWDGFFEQMGGPNPTLWMHGYETFNQTDAENFTVTSWPNNWPFTPGRDIDGVGGKILMGNYAQQSKEWVKIATNITIGSFIKVGVFNSFGTAEDFVVTGETVFVAMGRSFACWVLEAGSGHVAFYDKYSGILINASFYTMMGGLERYSLQISNTTYPLQPNSAIPTLTSGGVSPGSGTQLTQFKFSVIYTDADNNIPEYVWVNIGGTRYAMAKLNPADLNFVDGCTYFVDLYLQPASYSYNFSCSDWLHVVMTGSLALNVASAGNTQPPALSMPEVIPVYGFNGTTAFKFGIVYTEPENNAPNYVRLVLNSTIFSMAKQNSSDTNYVDGCKFELTMFLNVSGTYNYQFTCSDGSFSASTAVFTDLVVSSKPPLYFNGMTYSYRGYFDWSGPAGTWENRSSLITAAGGSKYFVNGTDGGSLWEDRYILDGSRLITNDIWSDFEPGSHDWIRIYADIGPGSTVILSVRQEGDQAFTVTGQVIRYSMGRSFECWILESARGSVAYYDKYSGLLVYGRFICPGMGGPGSESFYTINITGTNVPLAPNTNVPTLSGQSVLPGSGNQNILFTYSVVYTDLDDNAPMYVHVRIDGIEHTMMQVDPSDLDFTNGVTFQYSTYLAPAAHTYGFTCTDFTFPASIADVSGPTVTLTNSFTPQLLSPVVTPAVGINTTVFNFTVQYLDADNNAPSYVNLTIGASTYAMIAVDSLDTNFMDGKLYARAMTLANGNYQFRFSCSDGIRTNQTALLPGPVVDPMLPYINITLFSDDFESGLSKWTSATGLWHLTDSGSAWTDPYHSATHSMWFGNETFGTYATGGRSMGDLITIPIDLSVTWTAYLQFHHWRITDGGGDNMFVSVSIDGGVTWQDVYSSWSSPILPWQKEVINISQYCGNGSVLIRFGFDSMNNWNNNYRGWLVDDVLVYSGITDIMPVAEFTANITTILRYRSVQFNFTGIEGNPNASFLWNFGDGTSPSTQRNPVHQYNIAGLFTVSLRVTDADGDFNIMTKPNYITVTPNLLPLANFTANSTSIGIGQSVLFTFTGSQGDAPTIFQWNFGDGTANSSLINPPHQFVTAGTFTVSLRLTDINGDVSFLSRVAYITVIDYLPVANFTANVTQVYIGGNVLFTYTGTDGNVPITYQWNFGDGTGNSTIRNPIHTFSALGPHNVTVTVTDFDGDKSICRRINYIVVVADLLPVATFTANDTTIYKNEWVRFTFTGFDGDLPATLNWSFGDGTANDTVNRNPLHQYTSFGNFTVTLWIRDNDLDIDIEILVEYIHVIDRFPVANFTANMTSVGIGQNVGFTYTGTDGDPTASFQWSFDDGLGNSTVRNPVRSWSSAGSYDIIVTVNDSDGDISTMAKLNFIVVSADLLPVAAFVVNASRVVPGAWIAFTFTGADGDLPTTYQWNFGDSPVNGTARSPSHQYMAVGNFTVTLTVRDNDGDLDTVQVINCIMVTLKPVASFIANITTTGRNRWIQFTYTGTDGTMSPVFQWGFGDGTPNSTARNPVHAYATIDNYTVTVTVRDADGDMDVERLMAFIHIINLFPVPDFTSNSTQVFEGEWVQFTFTGDEGDMPASEFKWNFGDGSPEDYARNPTHQYLTDGSYPIILTVKDCELDITMIVRSNYIEVIDDLVPSVDFVANATSIIVGQSIRFTFIGTEGNLPVVFSWSFGDGTANSSDQNPTHKYDRAGTYKVTLTVIDMDGDVDTMVYSQDIVVQDQGIWQQILAFITEYWYVVIGGIAALVAIAAGAAAARKKSAAKANLTGAKGKKGASGAREAYTEQKAALTHPQILARLKHLIVFHRNTSLCLMYVPFDPLKKIDPQLISGFLSAITSFGGTFDAKAKLRVLDYQGFKILMEETEHCRHALMVEGEANDQIDDIFSQFIFEFENKYANEIASFRGDVTPYVTSGDIMQKVFQVNIESTSSVIETAGPATASEQQPQKPAEAAPAVTLQHLYCGTCQKWIDIPQGVQVTGSEKCETCSQPLYIVLSCNACGNSVVRFTSELGGFNKSPPACEKCRKPMHVQ